MKKRICKAVRVLCLVLAAVFTLGITVFAEPQVQIQTTVPKMHTVTVKADGAAVCVNGKTADVFTVERFAQPEFVLCPDADRVVKKLTFNGVDVTADMIDGRYTAEPIYCDSVLCVETAPVAANDQNQDSASPASSSAPRTGGRTNYTLWISLLLMSCGGIAGVMLKAHRAKKRTS